MSEIHCHSCGGLIADRTAVSYRLPLDGTAIAGPRTALCTCKPAIVYGPPPGYLSWPGLPSIIRTMAARN